MQTEPGPVRLQIKRAFMVVEAVATVLAAVLTVTNLAAGDWLAGALFGVLTASLLFQTAQAFGALTVDAAGIVDERVLGPGALGWEEVARVRVAEAGWLRPPLTIDVEGRARPVVGAAAWSLDMEVDGAPVDWDDARAAITAHARAAGVEIRHESRTVGR